MNVGVKRRFGLNKFGKKIFWVWFAQQKKKEIEFHLYVSHSLKTNNFSRSNK